MQRYALAGLFTISLCLLCILQLILPKQEVSIRENRTLTTHVDVSVSSFLEQTLQRNYEAFLSEQFFLREGMISFQHRFDQFIGMRQIQDVYLGKNEELFQKPSSYDPKKSEMLAEKIEAFTAQYPEITTSFLLVPNKQAIQDTLAPNFIDTIQQKDHIQDFYDLMPSNITSIDAIQVLDAHKEEYLYYRGDHHWTSLSAYLLAIEYLKQQGIEDTITYTPRTVNDAFYGTLANATGFAVADTIELYQPDEEEGDILVNYVEEKKKSTSVYAMEKQYSANPYEVFLDGNHALIEIKTSSTKNQNLLLFKDSYANCFIPFLLPYYHSIIVVDARYYYGDIVSLVQDYNINEALFLYNANTLFADTSLLSLLSEEY